MLISTSRLCTDVDVWTAVWEVNWSLPESCGMCCRGSGGGAFFPSVASCRAQFAQLLQPCVCIQRVITVTYCKWDNMGKQPVDIHIVSNILTNSPRTHLICMRRVSLCQVCLGGYRKIMVYSWALMTVLGCQYMVLYLIYTAMHAL